MDKVNNSDLINKYSAIALVFASCDNYEDLWDPINHNLNKYWKDNPLRRYLISNYKEYKSPLVTNIRVGPDVSWSDNLLLALDKIDEKFILIYMEDLFLTRMVDTQHLYKVFNWVLNNDPNYVRLIPYPKLKKKENEYIWHLKKGSLYRTALIPCIYKKKMLRTLLKPGESAWDLEIKGAIRSDKYDGFYSIKKPCYKYINAVIKSKWRKAGLNLLKKEGIEIKSGEREVMNVLENLSYFIFQQRSNLFKYLIPNKYKRSVRNILIKSN